MVIATDVDGPLIVPGVATAHWIGSSDPLPVVICVPARLRDRASIAKIARVFLTPVSVTDGIRKVYNDPVLDRGTVVRACTALLPALFIVRIEHVGDCPCAAVLLIAILRDSCRYAITGAVKHSEVTDPVGRCDNDLDVPLQYMLPFASEPGPTVEAIENLGCFWTLLRWRNPS